MPLLNLADLERDALESLTTFATIPCLSPSFDVEWVQHGYIDARSNCFRTGHSRAHWPTSTSRYIASKAAHQYWWSPSRPRPGRRHRRVVRTPRQAAAPWELVRRPRPYEPVRRDDRLFARGVGDDGYSTYAALLAIEAMEANDIPHSRCVVLIEASEESGSPDLEAYLDYLKDHLARSTDDLSGLRALTTTDCG